MERVIAYIDGFNLYHGLRQKGWKWFYWLNIQALVKNILKSYQILVKTKYFTSVVNTPVDKHDRQITFLEALQTLSDFQLYYGHFLSHPNKCSNCGHVYHAYHEKMTDVNIAVEMMADTFQDHLDTALLLSADSDLVGPIKTIKELYSQKRIVVVFPPARHSKALSKIADGCYFLGRDKLSKSLFPDKIVKADGFVLERPKKWR